MRKYRAIKSNRNKHFLVLKDNGYYYINLVGNTYFEYRKFEEGKCYYINDRYVLHCEPVPYYK